MTGRIPVAVLHARGRGQDHYWAHLWPRVRAFADPVYVAMPGPAGDAVAGGPLAPVEEVVDPHGSPDELARRLCEAGVRVVVPQVATDFCRHGAFFTGVLEHLRGEGVRIVATLHNVLPHDVFPVDRGELARLYALCDGYLVGNVTQRALLFEHFEVGTRPVAIAPHGPSVLLDRGRFGRDSARRHLGLPEKGPGILFFGNARRGKGLDLLAAALPRLRAARPDAFVYVSATAWLSESPDRETIDAEVRALGREPGVFARAECIPSEEIEPTFRACDLATLPYRAISQSGVLNAARAFRLPVVATETLLRADALAEGAGRIAPDGDPEAFAETLIAELAEPSTPPPPDETVWDRNAEALRATCEAVLRP